MKAEKMLYVEAEIELIKLDVADVITTSTDLGDGKDIDDGGWTSTSW